MQGIIGLIVVACLAAGPQGSGPTTVRIPLGEAGEVDVGEVISLLAERNGLAIPRPDAIPPLPVTGPAGASTRTLLTEALGPEVVVAVEPRELVVTLPAERLAPDELATRLRALADRARKEAPRDSRYGLRPLPSYRPNDPRHPTVCLIHGLHSSSRCFLHIVPALEAAGFGIVVYDYPYHRTLDLSAPVFQSDWTEFRHREGETRPWAIVAHSMGGLLARSYVEGDDYAGDVSDLILIGPPNQGTAVARTQKLLDLIQRARSVRDFGDGALSSPGHEFIAAAEDMVPGSDFLRALNSRARRAGVRYHILAGDVGLITPERREQVEARYRALVGRSGELLGGLARLALGDLGAQLDAVTDGTGDGCVAVSATRLDGVADHRTIHANHVELIRGPLLYPDPGPIACMPLVLEWLGVPGHAAPPPR